MMQKEGKTIPSVAVTAPPIPFCRYPTKVAQLMAIGPGVDSAITVIFIISSCVIHGFFSTQTFSIREIIAYPPPKVNSPISANDKNKSNSIVPCSPPNSNLNPTKLSAVRSFYRMLLNPRKRLKTLGFKQVNNSFPFIRPHPLLRASRELAREKSREDIGFWSVKDMASRTVVM